jgi:hypothetical protein
MKTNKPATPVNGPVVFLTFGILVGPLVLGLLDLSVSARSCMWPVTLG